MCIVLGIALSVQFRNTTVNSEKMQLERKSMQELMSDLLAEKDKSANLKRQLDDSNNKLEDYINAQLKNNSIEEVLKRDLEEAKLLAGLTDITGAGIIVRIDNTDSGWVNDSDLLTVLNELRAAGAYALSVNGERVVATTEIRQAGAYIFINMSQYSTPFTILAIGKPDTLEASLKLRNGVYDTFTKKYNLDMKIEKSENIMVPKCIAIRNMEYMRRVEQ